MSPPQINQIDIISEDEEGGTDYTMINRGSPVPSESSCPSESAGIDIVTRNSPRSGTFKCSQCFKVIEVGRPIYMRNDFPYCSKDCRELGVSSIYRVLFGSSIDNDAGFVNRLLRQIGGSNASLSSLEDFEDDDEDSGRPPCTTVANAARARARSFLNSIVGSMSKTSLGSSFIRTYSNGVLWGRDMTRNTSFNMLFAYLPELEKPTEGTSHPLSDSKAIISQVPSQSSNLSC